MRERRHNKRYKIELQIKGWIRPRFVSAEWNFSSVSEDLSRDGLRCFMAGDVRKEYKVELSIFLENGYGPFRAFGKIIWFRKSPSQKSPFRKEVRIKFTKISIPDKIRLFEYLRRLSGQKEEDI